MKRVAILTINDYSNYGNRLQNYAAQEVIKSLGFEVETIVHNRYTRTRSGSNTLKRKFWGFLSLSSAEKCKFFKIRISSYLNKNNQAQKIKAFKKFTDDYIIETNVSISLDGVPKDLDTRYDFFITGSDQVWNPTFGFGSAIDFLAFAPKQKRIAYAPSFGISFIPNDYIKDFKLRISEMGCLSVREEAGAKIIKELTGRDATVLIDPTLMLSKEKWISVSRQSVNKPKNLYLLTYFLGEVSKEYQTRITQIALENNLEIVRLADIRDRDRYAVDPGEFIDYINSASVFLTDSFHGVVFSILLEKPFIIFERVGKTPSMNSRIDTLLSTFNLKSRKYENMRDNGDIFDVEYSHVPPILEFEQNKARDYLKEVLCINHKG